MLCKYIEHLFRVPDTAAGRDPGAEDDFLSVVVLYRIVVKNAFVIRLADRPTGEAAGDLLNVFLRIAAVNPERVQLHQFAGVVLINAAGFSCRFVLCRRIFAQNARLPVVQIEQHRGRMCGRSEQIAKASQSKRTDRIAVKSCQQQTVGVFVGENAEMIFQKIDYDFVKLTLAVNGSEQFGTLQFGNDHARIFWHRCR